MIADGVEPSNTDRGYILRRLIRRAVRAEKKIGLNPESLSTITTLITKGYEETYPNLKDKNIFSIIDNERTKFNTTLDTGLKQLEKIEGDISGEDAFVLFSSYGFPLELTLEVAKEQGKAVDVEAFEKEMKQHQEKSKSSSAGKFKGGLGGHSEQELKYHTATHLLNAALRQVLGDHVEQKGSNINPERLRFDFSHPDKLTDEQKQAITDLVNKWIQEDHAISFEEMSPEEAKAQGAIGVFGDKYGEKVKVYSIGNVSKEICGGPHVEHTNTLGTFKIKKEEASSAGVRRIKAVLN
jgi:alanyl-tRNA synthetase